MYFEFALAVVTLGLVSAAAYQTGRIDERLSLAYVPVSDEPAKESTQENYFPTLTTESLAAITERNATYGRTGQTGNLFNATYNPVQVLRSATDKTGSVRPAGAYNPGGYNRKY